MPTSVRLDADTEKILERLARTKGMTKSNVIRDAIALAAKESSRSTKHTRPYDAFAPYIGIARGGPPDLSERTGEKFRKLLLEKRARRR